MKAIKILIISIISVLIIGIISGVLILVSPDSSKKDMDRMISNEAGSQTEVVNGKEDTVQSNGQTSIENPKDIGQLTVKSSSKSDQNTHKYNGTDNKLSNASGAGQKTELTKSPTEPYQGKTTEVRESNNKTLIVASASVEATENKTEATTRLTTELTTEATTKSTTESTTEATTRLTTESTTEATTRSTTESTTEATTGSSSEPTSEATTEAPTEHIHRWIAVYKTVKHEEVGHWEEIEAGQLEHPIVEGHTICSHCGLDFDVPGNENEFASHICPDGVKGSNYHNEQVIVGYWYEPFYDDVWVVDQKAYTEQVVDYYECSECGVRK